MYNIMNQSGKTAYNLLELIADSREDIADLPTTCTPGSTCLVIEDSSVWVLGSSNEWKEI